MANLNPNTLPIRILFRGHFRNLKDAKAALNYRIEIFDSKQNLWVGILDGKTLEEGRLVEEWEITKDNFQRNTVYYLVGEVIGSGGLPLFRVVQLSEEKEPEFIWLGNSTWVAADLGNNQVGVHFGDKLLTAPALLIPNAGAGNIPRLPIGAIFAGDSRSELGSAILAAVANPETFTAFDPEKQDLVLLDKFTQEMKEVTEATVIYDLDGKEVVIGKVREVIAGNPIEKLETDIRLLKEENTKIQSENEEIGRTLALKETENAALTFQLAEVRAELEQYKNEEIYKPQKSVPVNEILTSIASEVESTSATLVSGAYALTNVTLDLKAFVLNSPEGKLSLQLLDSEVSRTAQPGTISTLSMDLLPNSVGQPVPAGLVPRVIGMTETMARKKLMAVGLRMNAVYHPLHTDAVPPGHSFRQLPEGGADAQPGDEVTVIFAKQSTPTNAE